MENTAAEQIKRKLIMKAMAIYVMEVWLVLIVAAAKMMIGLDVDTKHVLIIKIQSAMIKVTSNKKIIVKYRLYCEAGVRQVKIKFANLI